MNPEPDHDKSGDIGRCVNCDEYTATVSLRQQSFTYGSGPDAVTLNVTVPVSECPECPECDDAWTGYEAEEIRKAAVRNHLSRIARDDDRIA
jgi:hypothetical protein